MMFRRPGPRLFSIALGLDFATEVIRGLEDRLKGQPPEAWGRVTILVPTRRMQRRLREVFDEGPPRVVPRIRLVSDVGLDPAGADLPPPVAPLRRRLELSQLIAKLLEQEPDLAPRARLFDLSDSLADLMEEMQGEGVPPDALRAIEVSDQSGHWSRSLRFLQILAPWFEAEGAPDGDARLRRVLDRLHRIWLDAAPQDPWIVAGATPARGPTARLMEMVARLPQGAVILAAHDPDLPAALWERLHDPLQNEDHPQHLHALLLDRLGLAPFEVDPWTATPSPNELRRRLVSLSLRPPPVTDQWLAEGPLLGDLRPALANVTLVEAPTPRAEAETIALRMREGIEEGKTCALVTPDRGLARAVAAALDRWGVAPDDSAGEPLPLSPPGRLLRQVADLRGRRPTADALLALLKHPLVHAGGNRARHLDRTRRLELSLRRKGPPQPDAAALRRFGAEAPEHDFGQGPWADWLAELLDALRAPGDRPLADHVADHLALSETLCAGLEAEGANPLWQAAAGREARATCAELSRHADAGGTLSPADYATLFQGVLSTAEVRERDRGHLRALIWGPLEARAQVADLVILGGLNDGVWPGAAPLDPWLNRRMREGVGLPLPERRIGQTALDYMQAMAAPEVWLTRAVRDHEAPTIPSRWLIRLLNLAEGLEGQGGKAAVKGMRERGDAALARAAALARPPARLDPAPRPSPRPPVEARPRRLAVTELECLRRDPYSIYAQRVLRLDELNPLTAEPDAMLRGTVIHAALERFMKLGLSPDAPDWGDRLLATAAEVLEEGCAWPVSRQLWLAGLERALPSLREEEAERQATHRPAHFEIKGEIEVEGLGVTLVAKADRVDLSPDGQARLLDYKTGRLPSDKQQRQFNKQLLLMAAMAARGAFPGLGPVTVADAAFMGLGSERKAVAAPLADLPPDLTWAELRELLARWMDPARGYSARMAAEKEGEEGAYDHLSRFGEWDHTTPVTPVDLA